MKDIQLRSEKSKERVESEIKQLGLFLVKFLKDRFNVLETIVKNYSDGKNELSIVEKVDKFGVKAPKIEAISFIGQMAREVLKVNRKLGLDD